VGAYERDAEPAREEHAPGEHDPEIWKVQLFALDLFLLSLRAACFVPDAVREDVCPSVFDSSIHKLGSGKRSSGLD